MGSRLRCYPLIFPNVIGQILKRAAVQEVAYDSPPWSTFQTAHPCRIAKSSSGPRAYLRLRRIFVRPQAEAQTKL
jgi:hypothetical protein